VKAHNRPESLVQGLMSIHTLFTADQDYIMQAKAMADGLGCDIHMHLSESVYEPTWVMEKYGKRPVELYEEWGYLGPNVVASQGVQLSLAEIDILARRGVRVVHMPLSNCEVGGGVAPIPAYLEKGIVTGLGTDGYVNNFFEVMRGAFLIRAEVIEVECFVFDAPEGDRLRMRDGVVFSAGEQPFLAEEAGDALGGWGIGEAGIELRLAEALGSLHTDQLDTQPVVQMADQLA